MKKSGDESDEENDSDSDEEESNDEEEEKEEVGYSNFLKIPFKCFYHVL